jgi:FMN phosphatase YigB (HAD superfamily)
MRADRRRVPVRAVIFDRDDTLVEVSRDLMAARYQRYRVVAPGLPFGISVSDWNSFPGPWPVTTDGEAEFWTEFWTHLTKRYDVPSATVPHLAALSVEYYREYVSVAHADSCVRALRAYDMRLALLTNCQLPSIAETLSHAGLDPECFEVLLSSNGIGFSKPHPSAYLAAASALRLPPQACAFVDNLAINVAGACAVGMRGIWLDVENEGTDRDIERIVTLSALVELLAPAAASPGSRRWLPQRKAVLHD